MTRQCYFKCLMGSHPPIRLPHNEEVTVGRSKITKIKDQSCSRQQLRLKADCEACVVEIEQLGINPSGLDGFAMAKCGVYRLGHGCKVEVLLNYYVHIIEFSPPPENDSKLKPGGKRKLDDSETTPMKKKALKMDLDFKVKEAPDDYWEDKDTGELYIFTAKGLKSSHKIAAFDMDGTLITTKSGKVHPIDVKDWQIAFPPIQEKLQKLQADGYKIVIFSNQAPIGNGRVKIEDFKKKIEGVVQSLGVPMQAYIATGKGIYRKPAIGMWKVLSQEKNDKIVIHMNESFYCGDAAGRVANWAPGKKKDHSRADKLFAENLGLRFFTPEQYFLGHSISSSLMSKPEFIPSELSTHPFNQSLIGKKQELLVLVGFPGSGKSYLAKQIEQRSGHQYIAVCRDVLGSWQKCAAKAIELLKQGKSVIIDSTNPDPESRRRWISLAKDMKVLCRCAKMTTTKAHSRHNNKFRELMKMNHVPVGEIIFNTYKNKFVEPTINEGFKEIIEVKFSPCFEDEDLEKIYRLHLLEK